jgi:hypothetical protein
MFVPPAISAAVGIWYGQDDEQMEGVLLQYVTEYRSDGTYTADFRHYRFCVLAGQWIEEGTWQREENRLLAFPRRAGGLPVAPGRVNEYVVESESPTLLQYRHLGTGILFLERRVGPSFTFPDCEPSS